MLLLECCDVVCASLAFFSDNTTGALSNGPNDENTNLSLSPPSLHNSPRPAPRLRPYVPLSLSLKSILIPPRQHQGPLVRHHAPARVHTTTTPSSKTHITFPVVRQ